MAPREFIDAAEKPHEIDLRANLILASVDVDSLDLQAMHWADAMRAGTHVRLSAHGTFEKDTEDSSHIFAS